MDRRMGSVTADRNTNLACRETSNTNCLTKLWPNTELKQELDNVRGGDGRRRSREDGGGVPLCVFIDKI